MNYQDLSKEVSYALRHAPWEYELEMDNEGWVDMYQLIEALSKDSRWNKLSETDLERMIELSNKKRHEIRDCKIRAFYGHSMPMKICKVEKQPPNILYHGTARTSLESIASYGLLPQARQYVHLSQDIETAIKVGERHDEKPIILEIDSQSAYQHSVNFYFGNEKVWLADFVPNQFIKVIKI